MTTIKLQLQTKKDLDKIKRKGESYDHAVQRIVKEKMLEKELSQDGQDVGEDFDDWERVSDEVWSNAEKYGW